jgi:hypothetical protein
VFVFAIAVLRVLRPEELDVARKGLRVLARRLPSRRERARGG